ncbi:MAG: 4-hydroxy-tetrahydrodipicolinate reductase [Flavobacteriales bacterium]|nr:4-hydroxy-tetrahydrodipicolinate reductase [Flavobacteriales bacterium]MCX7768432.1 4-hydroxy-tetrahydrodipicolinate reductase [Flavobacteriales bacterium]MDW8409675.1 4-hydroxy-tetrahydrodipicolinate reductase [Flavobacteriales bacterium]
MKALSLLIIGYGRMGQMVERVALRRGHLIAAIKDCAEPPLSVWLKDKPLPDVALEFTAPQAAFTNVVACLEAGIPVVCGTTGWYSQVQEAEQICRRLEGTLLVASNFSIGVNVLFEINRLLTSLMKKFPQYTPTLRETHHTAKKDMPSGTALSLAADIAEICGKKGYQLNQVSDPEKVPVFASRVPGEVGFHEVIWTSEMDQLIISHKAFSREAFAEGAVWAAEFIHGKKGLFTMRDVLGLKF